MADLFRWYPPGFDPKPYFQDATILDFGSGYGGRTVEYCLSLGARFAWGVEPEEPVVKLSNDYASYRNAAGRCQFLQCTETTIPLPDASVDLVVSYDVLEHVANPALSLAEIHRVLRPGGRAVIAFPVYDGAMSHHLDYIARVPCLHWVFSAETLVEAVNSILGQDDGFRRFGTHLQPEPRLSHDGSRRVLPLLNGMTGDQFLGMLGMFKAETVYFRPLLAQRWLGGVMRWLASLPMPSRLRDAMTSTVACILVKS